MLSDLDFSTPPCGLLDTRPDEEPLAPLNFDELLDIAREFEFTSTITHIWPCEEPNSSEIDTRLEDILAAIVPTPNTEEYPPRLPSSMPPEPVQEVHSPKSVSIPEKNEDIPKDPAPLPKDDQPQTEAGHPTLQGWSPPDGYQFLGLDDSLSNPQSATDMWISPWVASFFSSPHTQSERSSSPSLAAIPPMGEAPPPTSATNPKVPASISKTIDDPRRKTVPPPTERPILEPVQLSLAPHGSVNVSSRTVKTPHAKPKSRAHRSTTATDRTSAVTYSKAPRGGIPPHIARTVTKAHILRIEKERRVMQDAFSSTSIAEGKKPSVLRRTARDENEFGAGSGKNGDNEKEERSTKRARV